MPSFITIKSNQEFQDIFQKGHSINSRFLVVYFLNNSLPYNRFGFCVGRKLGTAVTRNRIKRLLREVIRSQVGPINSGFDIVIVAKSAILPLPFQGIRSEFEYILKKAKLVAAKK